MVLSKCPMCGSELQKTELIVPDYSYAEALRLLQCSGCELRCPENAGDVAGIYDVIYSGAPDDSYNRYFDYASDLKRKNNPLAKLGRKEPAYFAVTKALKDEKLPEGSRILEVGSGLGYFTFALNRSGFDAHGIDVSSAAVRRARETFGESMFSASTIDEFHLGIKFDCIIAIETIEHLEDPGAFLDRVIELLEPGGIIILTTPNKSFFPESVSWESSLPPVHLWWFTEESVVRASERRGLSAEFIQFDEYFSPTKTLFWDTKKTNPLYQGSLGMQAVSLGEARFQSKFLNWTKRLAAKAPYLMFTISKLLALLEPGRLLVAGRQCHCMGVVVRKPVSTRPD